MNRLELVVFAALNVIDGLVALVTLSYVCPAFALDWACWRLKSKGPSQ